ncbi:MAG: ERMES complex subunit [Alyxoria varia]|nr:MAG: ERMES complex subunit [Alyxoria varia]
MAFNFNWSPLIADTSRARDLLTTALNKSPKPPIIVDDIVVTELNLGSVPPQLEILEVGDLAVDRFRGIFKMQYSGDAFLTLKTRVQANPLNTYLSTKPSFAAPRPLAAASGLTIPLQITLSDIRLSGFVILVFSRQKGITLVFRNDPLESLKVSSTFDSIPFVRDYLQKEIEAQLRYLFMEDLPAIIHRLSLRLLSDEHPEQEADLNSNTRMEPGTPEHHKHSDSASLPLDIGSPELLPLFSDDDDETSSSFPQKNLIRLAALNDSNHTLSLFTPSISDAVFRAWAGSAERGDSQGSTGNPGLTLASLSRAHSYANIPASAYGLGSETEVPVSTSAPTVAGRPTLAQLHSAQASISTHSVPGSISGSSNFSGRTRGHPGRKRKHRVVNLRRTNTDSTAGASSSNARNVTSNGDRPSTPPLSGAPGSTASSHAAESWETMSSSAASREREGELITPPDSPERNLERTPRQARGHEPAQQATLRAPREPATSRPTPISSISHQSSPDVGTPQQRPPSAQSPSPSTKSAQNDYTLNWPASLQRSRLLQQAQEKKPQPSSMAASNPGGGILEQAWMMKMAQEIKVRVEQEQQASQPEAKDFTMSSPPEAAESASVSRKLELSEMVGEPQDQEPPPAYVE